MDPLHLAGVEEARRLVEEKEAPSVQVGLFDLDGVLRGRHLSTRKFLSALDSGFGFCDVVLGWESNDPLDDNARITGWHTGYPDAPLRILPDTVRNLPSEEEGLFFLCEFAPPADALCPRGLLRRAVERARELGFEPFSALAYQFSVFEESPHSVREKGYRSLKPCTPGNSGYCAVRASANSEFHRELLRLGSAMDFELESLSAGSGPGVMEASLAVDRTLVAGDKAALFKTFAKVAALRRGRMASFMARCSPDHPGHGGHIHLSLRDMRGRPVFHDPEEPHGMSETMRHFLGGCQKLMPEFLALMAPTINSYSRLVPGSWAPTNATWGMDNRTCALRVVPGQPRAWRLEYRIPGADANPYLAQAAALLSGLWGLEHRVEPGDPVVGNASRAELPEWLDLPTTLGEAAQKLRYSAAAREMLGDEFIEHFVATREWEEREFRRSITDWELRRYFESV